MSSTYAARTSVSPEQSRNEIERILVRYKATGFMFGWQGNQAMLAFEMHDRRVRFMVPLPSKDRLSESQHAQAIRQRWRAAVLTIKAKLEAVASGIVSFETEWMAHLVLPSGLTIGETLAPKMEQAFATGKMPPLLPDHSQQEQR